MVKSNCWLTHHCDVGETLSNEESKTRSRSRKMQQYLRAVSVYPGDGKTDEQQFMAFSRFLIWPWDRTVILQAMKRLNSHGQNQITAFICCSSFSVWSEPHMGVTERNQRQTDLISAGCLKTWLHTTHLCFTEHIWDLKCKACQLKLF